MSEDGNERKENGFIPRFGGLPEGNVVPAPQIVKFCRTLTIGFKVDRDVLERALPPGLEPHSNNVVQMNMYRVTDGSLTSHLDSYSLTYMTIEIEGHDSVFINRTGGEEFKAPGRYWVGYWNSSNKMRTFLRESIGVPCQPGETTWDWDGDQLTATLSIDGEKMVEAVVSAPNPDGDNYEKLARITGHYNYHARKLQPGPNNDLEKDELVQLPIPVVFEQYDSEMEELNYEFPESHRASKFAPKEPVEIHDVQFGETTFSYPQGRKMKNYLNSNNTE